MALSRGSGGGKFKNIFTIKLIKDDTYIAIVCIKEKAPELLVESLVTCTNKNVDIFNCAKAHGFYPRFMWLSHAGVFSNSG